MNAPSRFGRSRGVIIAVVLSIGLAASFWIFDSLSTNDGALIELDASDSTTAPDSKPGETVAPEVIPAEAGAKVTGKDTRPDSRQPDETSASGPEVAGRDTRPDSRVPRSGDRPRLRAAGAAEDALLGVNLEIEDAVSLEARANQARTLGRLDDAANYLELALSVKEEQLGPDHPSVAETLRRLAGVYAQDGRNEEAEAAYLRAVAINEQSGTRTVLAAAALSDLALFYRKEGRSDEALPLLKSALDIEMDVFGQDHPNVAARLAALGLLYRQQGLSSEAEPLLQEALLIRERVYGLEDPETTGAMTSLAQLYRDQERYAEAEDLLKRALVIHESMDDQPRVALDLANLSVVYVSNSQFSDAAPAFERALLIEGQNPWSPIPIVAQGVSQLAHSAQAAGNSDQAEEIYAWALDTSQRVLGSESPNTAFLRDQYIQYLRSSGRDDEATSLEEG